jgi:DNA repair exonuclease SbcCD nuclease subunit
MLRPREEQEDWFNIFVLHQNRVDRGPKTFIAEDMLPDFLDLVIWGHEHECRIIPEQNGRHHFFVCQPGRFPENKYGIFSNLIRTFFTVLEG